MGLGQGTNNCVELMALLLLQKFTREQGVHTSQIFGDSMNVINWSQKIQHCHNILILPILEEIYNILDTFDSFVLRHVYRNQNSVADTLSKEGIPLPFGHWHITESDGDSSQGFYHCPFINEPTQLQHYNVIFQTCFQNFYFVYTRHWRRFFFSFCLNTQQTLYIYALWPFGLGYLLNCNFWNVTIYGHKGITICDHVQGT